MTLVFSWIGCFLAELSCCSAQGPCAGPEPRQIPRRKNSERLLRSRDDARNRRCCYLECRRNRLRARSEVARVRKSLNPLSLGVLIGILVNWAISQEPVSDGLLATFWRPVRLYDYAFAAQLMKHAPCGPLVDAQDGRGGVLAQEEHPIGVHLCELPAYPCQASQLRSWEIRPVGSVFGSVGSLCCHPHNFGADR